MKQKIHYLTSLNQPMKLTQLADKAAGLIPVWATHIRVKLDDPPGSLPTQSVL